MAGPKEEYLIWDTRFELGFRSLGRMIAQLVQQTKELAASSKYLQKANDGLKDRIEQLDEQIQDLTASSRSLKEESNSLNDRILTLEQEITRQDQKSRLVREQLEGKLEAQGEDLKDVHATVTGMNEVSKAERGLREGEIRELKSQIEALIATRHTRGRHARDGKSREPAIRRNGSNT